jgi:signal transduction histidine kinase
MKVAREALVNAAKHAGPCRVTVKLESERGGYLRLTVADDGIGAHAPGAGHHHGLAAIEQLVADQSGWTTIHHGETGGTVVSVTMPTEFAVPPASAPTERSAAVTA